MDFHRDGKGHKIHPCDTFKMGGAIIIFKQQALRIF